MGRKVIFLQAALLYMDVPNEKERPARKRLYGPQPVDLEHPGGPVPRAPGLEDCTGGALVRRVR